jgi:hypothetical protein
MPDYIALPTTRATLESRQRNSPNKISPLPPPRSTLEAISRRQECSSQDSRRTGALPTSRTISTIPPPRFSVYCGPGCILDHDDRWRDETTTYRRRGPSRRRRTMQRAHYCSGRQHRFPGFRSLTLLIGGADHSELRSPPTKPHGDFVRLRRPRSQKTDRSSKSVVLACARESSRVPRSFRRQKHGSFHGPVARGTSMLSAFRAFHDRRGFAGGRSRRRS